MTAPNPNVGGSTQFNPYGSYGANTTSTYNTLPDGTMDLYNLGLIANKPIFSGVGYVTAGGASGEHGGSGSPAMRAQYTAAYQLVQNYARMSAMNPAQFAAIQGQLQAAGMYGSSDKPRYGAWTMLDGDAMSNALRGYLAVNQTGDPETFEEWLTRTAKAGEAAEKAANPIQLTGADTINAAGDAEAQQDLGRDLSESEKAALVSQYHSEETAAQTSPATANADGTTSVTGPGSVSAFAEEQLKSQHAGEYHEALQAGYVERMLSMFGVI